jgi:hypothetical protein
MHTIIDRMAKGIEGASPDNRYDNRGERLAIAALTAIGRPTPDMIIAGKTVMPDNVTDAEIGRMFMVMIEQAIPHGKLGVMDASD